MRDSGLPLLHRREAQKQAGQPRAAAVIESKLSGVAVRELVVAAILKEAPHGPRVPVEIAAELDSMASELPRIDITDFVHCVPCVHWCRRKSVSDSGIALDREPRGSPGVLAAESNALNAELADEVVHGVILRRPVHGQTRNRNRRRVHFVCCEYVIPGNYCLL